MLAEHCYTECHLCCLSLKLSVTNKPLILSVIMLNGVMLSVIMLNSFMLSVIMLNGVMLSIVAPIKVYPYSKSRAP
jgi:hypothetical protein